MEPESSPQPVVAFASRLAPVKMMVTVMALSPLLLSLIALVLFPGREDTSLFWWVLAFVLPVGCALWARVVGRRARPIDPSLGVDQAERRAIEQIIAASSTAIGIAEAGGLVMFGLSFAFTPDRFVPVLALVLSAAGGLWAVWPSFDRLSALQQKLGADGAPISVVEA